MESVRKRMCEEGVWAGCVRVCLGVGGGKGRVRRRKWIEIADALWGLQKINSSQEGKPQPPSCSLSLSLTPHGPSSHLLYMYMFIFSNLLFLPSALTLSCALSTLSSSVLLSCPPFSLPRLFLSFTLRLHLPSLLWWPRLSPCFQDTLFCGLLL